MMDKQELKALCDDLTNEIMDESTEEQRVNNLMKYSEDGKTISNAGLAAYCMEESREFTKKLLYSVLCEALDL
jgi:hypothetical protein